MAKIDAAKMWALNYRLLTSVITSVAGEVAALGLEVKDLFLLSELEEHPHPAELADALLMPKPTVTVTLKRLEAAGFVKREIDASDLRRHRITLTASGRKAMTRGLLLFSQAFEARLDRLSAAEQSQLQKLIEVMAVS
jgi:DNA-binding MarR family transcriptional regulator